MATVVTPSSAASVLAMCVSTTTITLAPRLAAASNAARRSPIANPIS